MSDFSRKIYILCPLLLIVSFLTDQLTKYLALTKLPGHPISLISGILSFTYLENRGVGFGMLQNRLYIILIVNALILAAILYLFIKMPKEKRFLPVYILMTLVVSGALGNIIDRLRLGYVVDFIYIELIDFPIFNVADIYVSVSIFIFAFFALFKYKSEDLNYLFTLTKEETNNQNGDEQDE